MLCYKKDIKGITMKSKKTLLPFPAGNSLSIQNIKNLKK